MEAVFDARMCSSCGLSLEALVFRAGAWRAIAGNREFTELSGVRQAYECCAIHNFI